MQTRFFLWCYKRQFQTCLSHGPAIGNHVSYLLVLILAADFNTCLRTQKQKGNTDMMQSNFRKQPLPRSAWGTESLSLVGNWRSQAVVMSRPLRSVVRVRPPRRDITALPRAGDKMGTWSYCGCHQRLLLACRTPAGGRLTGVTRHREASPATNFRLRVCAEHPQLAERSQKPAG